MEFTDLSSKNHLAALSTRWILEYRWAMLAAVGVSLLFVFLSQLSPVPEGFSLVVLVSLPLAAAASQFLLQRRSRRGSRVSASLVTGLLIADTLGLTALFLLTGGSHNPFTILYLAQISLSMIVVGAFRSIPVFILANLGFASLFLLPQSNMHMEHHAGFTNHLQGMLVAFVLTSALLAYFLVKASKELAELRSESKRAERHRDEQLRLASLTSLAAETAHELATPLSTIALSAQDLVEAAKVASGRDGTILANAEIIDHEICRSKMLLDRMVIQGGSLQGEVPTAISIEQLVEMIEREAAQRWSELSISFDTESAPDSVRVPIHSLVQQTLSLVKNSREAGAAKVQIVVRSSGSQFDIVVFDDGQGFSEQVKSRLGQPFVSTKDTHDGMGLGLFVLRLFCEKYAGSFSVRNRMGQGAEVSLSLPKTCSMPSDHSIDAGARQL